MDLTQTLWNSKTSGHKKLIAVLVCLVLLVPSLIGLVICMMGDDASLKLIMVIVTVAVVIVTGVVLVVAKYTALKWDVSNLVFAVAKSGLYFTGTVNQNSYFSAELLEIAGYSVKQHNNGKATVTVKFNGVADAGSFGKLTFLKMVGVNDTDKLIKAFESLGINKI